MTNGRNLVVEYKGGHLYDGVDAEEKRVVGAIWEARSNRRGLFVMPSKLNWSAITDKIRG
jgi:type III restriction enzyme